MAGATLTTFDKVLKEYYPVDTITELVKQNFPFFYRFKRSKMVSSDGRQVILPLHTGRNVGVSARGEGGLLPTAGSQEYVDLTIPYRYTHLRVQWTAQALKQSRTSEGAWETIVEGEMQRGIKDVARELSRQLQGDGTGTLCKFTGTDAGTSQGLKDGQGVADNDSIPGRFLKAGMRITGITPSTKAWEFTRLVDSISSDLKTVVLTATVTPSEAGTIIVKGSSSSDSALADCAYAREMMGLLGMIDDGTYVASYFGNTRSSYPKLYAYVLDFGNGALSLDKLQQAFDGVDQQSDGYPNVMIANHVTRREYTNLLQAYKRYVNERALTPDGGLKGGAIKADVEFNEVPMMADRDVPMGILHGIDMETIQRFMLTEGEWADEDGTIMLRDSTTDAFEGRYRVFGNVACLAPNRNFTCRSIKLNNTVEAIQVAD
jgi:hypothetical protein